MIASEYFGSLEEQLNQHNSRLPCQFLVFIRSLFMLNWLRPA